MNIELALVRLSDNIIALTNGVTRLKNRIKSIEDRLSRLEESAEAKPRNAALNIERSTADLADAKAKFEKSYEEYKRAVMTLKECRDLLNRGR